MRSHQGLVVNALGIRVLLATTDQTMLQLLDEAWSGCVAPDDALPDVTVQVTGRTVAEAMEHATQQVTERAVECRAGELLMLHSAVVSDDRGKAVLLVGPSGMGKTTAAMTLGARFRYVTDETAGIDSTGCVVPYPKPLSVRSARAHKEQRSPRSLGLVAEGYPTKPVAVLLLDRRSIEGGLDVERLSPVVAIAQLSEHTSFLARLDRPLHRIAEVVLGSELVASVRYSHAADLEQVVEGVLECRP